MRFLLKSNYSFKIFVKNQSCKIIYRYIYQSNNYDLYSINNKKFHSNNKAKLMNRYHQQLQKLFKNNNERINELKISLSCNKKMNIT